MKAAKMQRWTGTLALLAALACAADAQASFQLTTSTSGVSYSGGSLTEANLTAGQVIPIDGGSIVVGSAGGSAYTDASGTTLYLLNDRRTASITAIPNEQIYVTNTTSGATDTGVFNFNTNILVTYAGASGTFVEGPSTLTLNLTGGDENYQVLAGGVAPPSLNISGAIFTSSNPQGVSGDINSLNNGAVSAVIHLASVPEPASIAMLGMGAIGVGTWMVRRRRSSN